MQLERHQQPLVGGEPLSEATSQDGVVVVPRPAGRRIDRPLERIVDERQHAQVRAQRVAIVDAAEDCADVVSDAALGMPRPR